MVKAYINSTNYQTTAIDYSSNIDNYPWYSYVEDFPDGQSSTISDDMIIKTNGIWIPQGIKVPIITNETYVIIGTFHSR